MEDIETADSLTVEEDDTDYTGEPLMLAELSDLYHVELGDKQATGGEVCFCRPLTKVLPSRYGIAPGGTAKMIPPGTPLRFTQQARLNMKHI